MPAEVRKRHLEVRGQQARCNPSLSDQDFLLTRNSLFVSCKRCWSLMAKDSVST